MAESMSGQTRVDQQAQSQDIESLPVTVLKGVGPKVAERLARFGLHTLQDVLFHLPFRYQDRTRIEPIGSLLPGRAAVVVGTIEATDINFRGRRVLLSRISDGTGFLTLRFFHFSNAQKARLKRGAQIYCYAEVRTGRDGLEMVHPEYELMSSSETVQPEDTLTPVYPVTEGVHQLTLRKLTQQVLDRYIDQLPEWLPESVLHNLSLLSLREAVATVHRPAANDDTGLLLQGIHPAQRRLAFEELLAHQLSLVQLRQIKTRYQAASIKATGALAGSLLSALPFSLTSAQQRVIAEIKQDLVRDHPMQRLVQGDVGSGKTLVAALAAATAIEAGWQVALMAPTELLVEQHARNMLQWFEPLGIRVTALQGKLNASRRRMVLQQLATHDAQLIVGTHALFQDDVDFKKLGLVIVDEQHRFGVHQRLALWEKGKQGQRYPHQLIMTATPIPRTLAQTVYADLDVSVIDELPPGRQPVITVVMLDDRRPDIVERVAAACAQGRQAYWVCALIEESEALQLQTATETEQVLKQALPQLRIAMVHGRMKPSEKESVMLSFQAGDIDLLVATTVIEVGVDVPNASLMIIENAERLGLSQLHQLRGRVGRGCTQSSCVLMYKSPLSETARKRLAVMRDSQDGFYIAQQDLELRGPGEMLGARQTGMPRMRIADLARDQALLPDVQAVSKELCGQHPLRVKALIRRWLGETDRYQKI